MAAKQISVKKYVVRLSGEERELLGALLRKGKSPAQRMLKARIADGAKPKVAVGHAGKPVRAARSLELSTSAENAHLAAQIGLAVSQSLK